MKNNFLSKVTNLKGGSGFGSAGGASSFPMADQYRGQVAPPVVSASLLSSESGGIASTSGVAIGTHYLEGISFINELIRTGKLNNSPIVTALTTSKHGPDLANWYLKRFIDAFNEKYDTDEFINQAFIYALLIMQDSVNRGNPSFRIQLENASIILRDYYTKGYSYIQSRTPDDPPPPFTLDAETKERRIETLMQMGDMAHLKASGVGGVSGAVRTTSQESADSIPDTCEQKYVTFIAHMQEFIRTYANPDYQYNVIVGDGTLLSQVLYAFDALTTKVAPPGWTVNGVVAAIDGSVMAMYALILIIISCQNEIIVPFITLRPGNNIYQYPLPGDKGFAVTNNIEKNRRIDVNTAIIEKIKQILSSSPRAMDIKEFLRGSSLSVALTMGALIFDSRRYTETIGYKLKKMTDAMCLSTKQMYQSMINIDAASYAVETLAMQQGDVGTIELKEPRGNVASLRDIQRHIREKRPSGCISELEPAIEEISNAILGTVAKSGELGIEKTNYDRFLKAISNKSNYCTVIWNANNCCDYANRVKGELYDNTVGWFQTMSEYVSDVYLREIMSMDPELENRYANPEEMSIVEKDAEYIPTSTETIWADVSRSLDSLIAFGATLQCNTVVGSKPGGGSKPGVQNSSDTDYKLTDEDVQIMTSVPQSNRKARQLALQRGSYGISSATKTGRRPQSLGLLGAYNSQRPLLYPEDTTALPSSSDSDDEMGGGTVKKRKNKKQNKRKTKKGKKSKKTKKRRKQKRRQTKNK
jgi:hypothetical protein